MWCPICKSCMYIKCYVHFACKYVVRACGLSIFVMQRCLWVKHEMTLYLHILFFLTFLYPLHPFVLLTIITQPSAQLSDIFFVSCSPWRLCGPQPGPPSPFCPVDRSRLFSTRCLSSETCTKASTAAWRHGWMLTATLNQTQERRERGATQALSWWWETCSWKWWACCCVKMTTCVYSWVMLRNLLETNKYMGQRHKENRIGEDPITPVLFSPSVMLCTLCPDLRLLSDRWCPYELIGRSCLTFWPASVQGQERVTTNEIKCKLEQTAAAELLPKECHATANVSFLAR